MQLNASSTLGRPVPRIKWRTRPRTGPCRPNKAECASQHDLGRLTGPSAPRSAGTSATAKESDSRLKGFPSLLDKEIVQMAIPSLAAIVVDPLMGMVDVGACIAAVQMCVSWEHSCSVQIHLIRSIDNQACRNTHHWEPALIFSCAEIRMRSSAPHPFLLLSYLYLLRLTSTAPRTSTLHTRLVRNRHPFRCDGAGCRIR